MRTSLFVLPFSLAFLGEGSHSFLLVVQREHGMEDASLETQAFVQRHFIGSVDRFLGHHHCREGKRGDLLGSLVSFFQQLRERVE
jgi:hypothetical protein